MSCITIEGMSFSNIHINEDGLLGANVKFGDNKCFISFYSVGEDFVIEGLMFDNLTDKQEDYIHKLASDSIEYISHIIDTAKVSELNYSEHNLYFTLVLDIASYSLRISSDCIVEISPHNDGVYDECNFLDADNLSEIFDNNMYSLYACIQKLL